MDLNQRLGDFLEEHVDSLDKGLDVIIRLPLGGDREGEELTLLVTAIEEAN